MQSLPNNCRCGKFSVFPSNWESKQADHTLTWRINYWFYDDNLKAKKQIVIKGMNDLETLKEKQQIVRVAIKDELRDLKEGYNPFQRSYSINKNCELSLNTGLLDSLLFAFSKIQVSPTTKIDIKSCLKFLSISIKELHLERLPVSQVKRRHVKLILDHCGNIDYKDATGKIKEKIWTANQYNHYRKYLGILFSELVEMEVMEMNLVRDIRKKKTIRKIKKILTPEECQKISDWVKIYDRHFWLLIHIFFHSGCRTTEIFRVKKKHVNLENQTLLVTVLKGNQPFEVRKPIKDIAIDFWREIIKDANSEDFIFSKGLVPGQVSINPRQATRRWKRHMKNKLKIDCDWYALKHLNTDQISKEKGLKTAGLLNSHTSDGTTKIYAINEQVRMNEEIKHMKNKFA